MVPPHVWIRRVVILNLAYYVGLDVLLAFDGRKCALNTIVSFVGLGRCYVTTSNNYVNVFIGKTN